MRVVIVPKNVGEVLPLPEWEHRDGLRRVEQNRFVDACKALKTHVLRHPPYESLRRTGQRQAQTANAVALYRYRDPGELHSEPQPELNQ